MTDQNALVSNKGWQIGFAIEAGMDEEEARHRASTNELAELLGLLDGGVGGQGGGSTTGLGGLGVALGSGVAGIGALTAVGAPAVAAGGVGYAVARAVSGIGTLRRDHLLRVITEFFGLNGQVDKVVRLFEIEGKGRLVNGRRPPDSNTSKSLLELLQKSESAATVGLFGSPDGKFVVSFDLLDGRYAYAVLQTSKRFTGGGIDSRGAAFDLDGVSSVDLLIRILEREDFLRRAEELEEQD